MVSLCGSGSDPTPPTRGSSKYGAMSRNTGRDTNVSASTRTTMSSVAANNAVLRACALACILDSVAEVSRTPRACRQASRAARASAYVLSVDPFSTTYMVAPPGHSAAALSMARTQCPMRPSSLCAGTMKPKVSTLAGGPARAAGAVSSASQGVRRARSMTYPHRHRYAGNRAKNRTTTESTPPSSGICESQCSLADS